MTLTGGQQDDVDLFRAPAPAPRNGQRNAPSRPTTTRPPLDRTPPDRTPPDGTPPDGTPRSPSIGTAGPVADRHRSRRSALPATAGVVSACVLAGIALGVAVTSPSPIGVLDPDPASPVPAVVVGQAGLTPGSEPVDTPVAGPFTAVPTAVTLNAALLPRGCPATAWRVALTPPAAGATSSDLDARAGTIRITAGLAPSAPQSCQGFSGELPLLLTLTDAAGSAVGETGSRQVSARTASPVTVAVLATPSLSLERRDAVLVVVPAASPSGPAASGYSVEGRLDGQGWSTICSSTSAVECVAPAALSGGSGQFRVLTSLGSWHRVSPAVTAAGLS